MAEKESPMKRTFALSFFMLLGSAALAAQAIDMNHPQGASTVQMVFLNGSPQQNPPAAAPACPVSMRAQHAMGGALVKATPGHSTQRLSFQRLVLTLTNRSASGITGATVTVHGTTGKARVMPAGASGDDDSDDAQVLDLAFDQGAVKETSANLAVRGLTSVSRIDLNSVTYADGTTWKSDSYVCYAVPDPNMLVSAR
jgi:hypothetical protein